MRLVQVTAEILDHTRTSWGMELEDVPFSPSGYDQLLDSIAYKLESKTENIYYYALMAEGEQSATAILELSHVLPNLPETYLKVLSIRMTPKLDTRNTDTESNNRVTRHREIAQIAASCIAEVLILSESEHKAPYFKLFTTSTQTDLEMLLYVTDSLQSTVLKEAGIEADHHGNWLVIRKS